MTLDEKRQVIEVLMCAAAPRVTADGTIAATNLVNACDAFFDNGTPERRRLFDVSCARRRASANEHKWGSDSYRDGSPYALSAITAAYRLIESSPTLRREWFGAR